LRERGRGESVREQTENGEEIVAVVGLWVRVLEGSGGFVEEDVDGIRGGGRGDPFTDARVEEGDTP